MASAAPRWPGATTTEDGSFTIAAGIREGPFLVVLTAGSTVDAASGATVQLGSDEQTALVPRFVVGTCLKKVCVSPISHFAALDWRTVFPAALTVTTSIQEGDTTQVGLLLAEFSQQALTLSKQTGTSPRGL